MPESQIPSLIATLPPTREQTRAGLVISVLLFVLFLFALSLAPIQLARVDAFIPIVATVMFLTDSITATLLFAQFSTLRSRALLILANGYLFTALTIIPYALTFPGAFAPTGLFGGRQSPPWFNTLWHIGLPIAIIAYVLLSNAPTSMRLVRTSTRFAILASVTGVTILVCAVTWFITAHDELVPALLRNDLEATGLVVKLIGLIFLALSGTAALLLLILRRSMLDLGLLVVSQAWLLGSLLFIYVQTRYTVGWYAIRFFEITAASLVLLALLAESTMLYARLALSIVAQHREREGRRLSMDVMSAAIAHEIKQPLSAMMMNAEAGLRWLTKTPPGLDEVGETLKGITASGHRASEVLQSVRSMFAKSDQPSALVDTNDLIRETVA